MHTFVAGFGLNNNSCRAAGIIKCPRRCGPALSLYRPEALNTSAFSLETPLSIFPVITSTFFSPPASIPDLPPETQHLIRYPDNFKCVPFHLFEYFVRHTLPSYLTLLYRLSPALPAASLFSESAAESLNNRILSRATTSPVFTLFIFPLLQITDRVLNVIIPTSPILL